MKNEVRDATHEPALWRVSVARPVPQVANQNWFNAHNFYGDLADIDAATLRGSAVLLRHVLRAEQRRAGGRGRLRPGRDARVDPRSTLRRSPRVPSRRGRTRRSPSGPSRKRDSYVDRLAPRPARSPSPGKCCQRNTPEHYAFSLLDTILLQGEDSRLWRSSFRSAATLSAVGGGTNLLGKRVHLATGRCSGCFT